MKILLSIGGASGSIYGIRLLEELKKAGAETHLIVSDGAKKIIEHETNYTFEDIKKKVDFVMITQICLLDLQADLLKLMLW